MLCAKSSGIARGQTLLVARRNVWRKAVSTSIKGILERDHHFFAVVLSQMDSGNVDMRKSFCLNNHEICDKSTDIKTSLLVA